MIVVLALIGVLAVGGAVAGLILATSGKKHEAQHTGAPTGGPTGGAPSSHDFPTSAGLPTGGGASGIPSSGIPSEPSSDSAVSADDLAIAENAEAVMHGLAANEPEQFCPLIDPADLKRVLKETDTPTCNDLALNSKADRAAYQTFTVVDPSAIEVSGTEATIPGSAIRPARVGDIDMRKDTDGTWKYRFYSD